MSRAFLICPEPVRSVTAGVGSRFVTLAGVLAGAGHEVTLAVPSDPADAPEVADGVTFVRADESRLGEQADGHDWILLHAHLGNHYLQQRDDLPVVVDLYDPFLIENLHYHRELGPQPFRNDHATWRLQMSRGDFFLCSSEEQRLFYLGWLSALGRVNPLAVESDPSLRRLIAELPFGTPDEPPPEPPARADVLPDAEAGAPVLYFGGIYDWYDPHVVLEALPPLLDRDPRTVVVFVDHPHPETTPLSVARSVRDAAKRAGWLGSTVRFEAWRPFERRFELPLVADLAVVTHRPGIETELSLRTRLVDLMWLGLPSVVTEGGTMARVVSDTGAGEVVPAADAVALAAAIARLLDDRGHREHATRAARDWVSRHTWAKVAGPLLDFAEAPRRDPNRGSFDQIAPGEVIAEETLLGRIQRVLRRQRGGS
jgi:glycosyltransferase involved in cell wall biosynthesis